MLLATIASTCLTGGDVGEKEPASPRRRKYERDPQLGKGAWGMSKREATYRTTYRAVDREITALARMVAAGLCL